MTLFLIAMIFLMPLGLSVAAQILYRRTGHGIGWQLAGFTGLLLAALVLVLPSTSWLHAKLDLRHEFAIIMAFLIPGTALLVLALKPWPRPAVTITRSET